MRRILLTALSIILLMSCTSELKEQIELKEKFQNPAAEYQARSWWRWLGGNISKDGITKDLESIKDKGMNGVTFFNLGHYFPKGDVVFGSDEWLQLFDFSVDECERLGLDFSFQMCDGWGASGGPWVTKDNAMKVITSSKVLVKGGELIEMNLPQPRTNLDYYKDLKAYAYPAYHKTTPVFTSKNVKIKTKAWTVNPEYLMDGERYSVTNFGIEKGGEPVINFELDEEAEIAGINLHQGDRETPVGPKEVEFQYSLDGVNYTKVARFTMSDLVGGATFNPVKAKYFRIYINTWTERAGNGNWAFLSEIELLAPGELSQFPQLNDFEIKASIWHRRRGLDEVLPVDEKYLIEKESIIDISENFINGKLSWEAPAGDWTIVRMGYTLTGRKNGPATEEGTGLECDKLSKEAVTQFYDGYAGKLLKRNANHCGKTITRLFADSFEALAQNWTPEMWDEFAARTGYSLAPYFLIFSGEVIESVEVTEALLRDYRNVLSDLIAENYYAQLNSLCHQDNVEFVAQIAGEQQMLANPIKYASMVDGPATEFWIGGSEHSDKQGFWPNGSVFDAISSSHIYSKKVIPTEAFTRNWSDFSSTPNMLKHIGDKAFSYGINQFEMHTYIHQPEDKLPGWQHYMFGIAFGRNVTWWNAADEMMNYFTRAQTILQEGKPVSDILLYTGEEIPNSIEWAYKIHMPEEIIPQGYKFDIINKDVLLGMLSVNKGNYTLSNGLQYSILVLPPSETMSVEVAEKVLDFAKSGGVVIGEIPGTSTSYNTAGADEEKLSQINKELSSLKNARLYGSMKIEEALKAENILPDFSYKASDPDAEVVFYHRSIGDKEVYFVANQEMKTIAVDAIFRQNDKACEIWNPETGEVKTPLLFVNEKGYSKMPLTLKPYESCFVVFSDDAKSYATKLLKDGQQLYPYEGLVQPLPVDLFVANAKVFTQNGEYELIDTKGKSTKVSVTDISDEIVLSKNWKVTFDTTWGGPESINFDYLLSWTQYTNPGLKYYSGKAIYTKEFQITKEQLNSSLTLDLGLVREVAEIYLNGKYVGTQWNDSPDFEITDFVKEGENTLVVEVVNTWNNRIAGDDLHPKEEAYCYYPVRSYSETGNRRKYTDKDVLASGLFGPVTISSIHVVELED